MSKKHYIAFAEMIRSDKGKVSEAERRYAANLIATIASDDNNRFDCARFFKACDIERN